jgi:hypothetical protein
MQKVQVERHEDKAVFSWLEEMGAKTYVNQKYWEILAKNTEDNLEKPLIKTYQELMNKIGEVLKDDPNKFHILQDIFTKGAGAYKDPSVRETIKKLIDQVRISAGLALPKGMVRTIEELEGMPKFTLKLKSFASDLKFLLTNIEQVEPVVKRMTAHLSEEEQKQIAERMRKSIEEYGFYFGYGESALTASLRKLMHDMERYPETMRKEFFGATYMGTHYGSFAEEVASSVPVSNIVKQVEDKLPQRIVDSLKGNLDTIENVWKYLQGLPQEVTDKVGDKFDDVMNNLGRLFHD